MMTSKVIYSFIDYGIPPEGGEPSSASFIGAAVTAANYDATLTELAAIRTGIAGVVLGGMVEQKFTAEVMELTTYTPVTSPNCQRENKWKVTFSDGLFRTIPNADLTKLAANGSDMAAGAARTALELALNGYVTDEAGAPLTVVSIKFVGRNT